MSGNVFILSLLLHDNVAACKLRGLKILLHCLLADIAVDGKSADSLMDMPSVVFYLFFVIAAVV